MKKLQFDSFRKNFKKNKLNDEFFFESQKFLNQKKKISMLITQKLKKIGTFLIREKLREKKNQKKCLLKINIETKRILRMKVRRKLKIIENCN